MCRNRNVLLVSINNCGLTSPMIARILSIESKVSLVAFEDADDVEDAEEVVETEE